MVGKFHFHALVDVINTFNKSEGKYMYPGGVIFLANNFFFINLEGIVWNSYGPYIINIWTISNQFKK